MKAFIDRWYSVPRDVFAGKRIILAVSSGGGPIYADLMVKTFEEMLDYLNMEKYKVLQTGGAGSKMAAMMNAELMKEAHATGFDAVKTLKT